MTRTSVLRPIIAIALLGALGPTGAAAPDAPPSAHVHGVIVILKEAHTSDDVRKDHPGGRPLAAGVLHYEADVAAKLARDERILSIEADQVVRAATASWDRAGWDTASWDTASWDRASWDRASWDGAAALPAPPTWGAMAIGAGSPPTGGPVTVCLVDSGVDAAHPFLASRLWRDEHGNAGIDLVDDDLVPEDVAGHGTHLAGIIAAQDGGPMRGVSEARIASAKIFDGTGIASTSDLIEGISWCQRIRAGIILLALSEDAPTRALEKALKDARNQGAVIVASAGNEGPCERCVSSPARSPHVMAIASLDLDLSPSAFGASGPEVQLALPGSGVLSTYPGNSWRYASGTSQAAAFAAGAIARVAGEEGLEPSKAARIVVGSAMDLGRPGRDADTGYGIPALSAAHGRAAS